MTSMCTQTLQLILSNFINTSAVLGHILSVIKPYYVNYVAISFRIRFPLASDEIPLQWILLPSVNKLHKVKSYYVHSSFSGLTMFIVPFLYLSSEKSILSPHFSTQNTSKTLKLWTLSNENKKINISSKKALKMKGY